MFVCWWKCYSREDDTSRKDNETTFGVLKETELRKFATIDTSQKEMIHKIFTLCKENTPPPNPLSPGALFYKAQIADLVFS